MLKRFDELGGKTPRNALIITIEKYRNLWRYWDNIRVCGDHDPHSTNCALCSVHLADARTCTNNGGCPLRDNDTHGCWTDSDWEVMDIAITLNDRPRFNRYRRRILERCKAALKQMEESERPGSPDSGGWVNQGG
jgi:hypothetical protein